MKAVYRFYLDCGRGGDLSGVFVAESELIDALIETELEVYFGEVLGKYSEVWCSLGKENFTMITDSPEVVTIIEKHGLENGINPLDYNTVNEPNFNFNDGAGWWENLTVGKILQKYVSAFKHVNWDCKFCGKDTYSEYYMLKFELWDEVNKGDGNTDGLACLNCVEEKLGRKLTRDDFLDCDLNINNEGIEKHLCC